MVNISEKEKCCGCTACYHICPVGAIKMAEDCEGFLYPEIDKEKCIGCNKCDMVCQYKTSEAEQRNEVEAYAAYNKDEKERWNSSSGGIFSLLAQKVLEDGGYVVGAAFDDNWNVYHKMINRPEDLASLMGSKYVQSNLGNIFLEIKKILEGNHKVLFVGTGCQVKGLKLYLKKEYDQLICVDLICLGVPSPRIWRSYLKTYFHGNQIEKINFKDKSLGWHRFSVKIDAKQCLREEGRSNYYMNGYFRGYYTRPSCYNCMSKGIERVSDLTLADCWGIEHMNPLLDDNKGTSTILVHTQNGKKIWNQINEKTIFAPIDVKDVVLYNKGVAENKRRNKLRNIFWFLLKIFPTKVVFTLFCSPSLVWYLKQIKRAVIRKK